LVNLPVSGSVQFDISGTVAPGTTGTISNSATVVIAAGITDPQPANNTITVNTTPVPEADVAVGLSSDPIEYTPGAQLNYTLVVNNAGPGAAPATTVVDIFPAVLSGVTWTCSGMNGATCPPGGSGNLSLQVNLPSTGEVVFEVTGTVSPIATAALSNSLTAVVSGAVIDPVPKNNSASIDTVRKLEADVAVDLVADATEYLAGQPIGYSVVVENAGPDAATGTQIVTLLPVAVTGIDWTCSATGGAACNLTGSGNLNESVDLPPSASVTFEVIGTVAPGTMGPITAVAVATTAPESLDPNLEDNSASVELAEGNQSIEIFANGFED
jgi:uncharacterized repeat protein (TIGR01451 family)